MSDRRRRKGLDLAPLALLAICSAAWSCQAAPHQDASAARNAAPPALALWDVLGTSREGFSVRAVSTGQESAASRASARDSSFGRATAPRVAILAGIHGDEREGGRHLAELLEVLPSYRGSVRVYEDVNPDGTWRGARSTSKGVDPNRNWPAENFRPSRQNGPAPLSEPSVAAVHADLVQFDPELVLVLHSTSRGPFVNYDGPAEAFSSAFARAAGAPWTVEPSMGYPTPGSFGSWMGVDRKIPTLTIEFKRGCPEGESRPALLAGVKAVLGLP